MAKIDNAAATASLLKGAGLAAFVLWAVASVAPIPGLLFGANENLWINLFFLVTGFYGLGSLYLIALVLVHPDARRSLNAWVKANLGFVSALSVVWLTLYGTLVWL